MFSTVRRLGLGAMAAAGMMLAASGAQAVEVPEAAVGSEALAAAIVAPMIALPSMNDGTGAEETVKTAQRFRRRRARRRARRIGRGVAIGAAIVGGAILLNEAARANEGRRRGGYRRAQDRCADRFNSYSYRTDTYVTHGGVEKLCPYLRRYY